MIIEERIDISVSILRFKIIYTEPSESNVGVEYSRRISSLGLTVDQLCEFGQIIYLLQLKHSSAINHEIINLASQAG